MNIVNSLAIVSLWVPFFVYPRTPASPLNTATLIERLGDMHIETLIQSEGAVQVVKKRIIGLHEKRSEVWLRNAAFA